MEKKDKKEVVFVDMGKKLAETGLDKFIDCNVSFGSVLISMFCMVGLWLPRRRPTSMQ